MKRRTLLAVLTAVIMMACSSTVPVAPREPSPENPVYLVRGGAVTSARNFTAPAVVRRVDPEYGKKLQKARTQGTVVLNVVVDETGAVQGMRVVQSAGADLDNATTAAVKQWQYKPATLDGEPVAVFLDVTVTYRLQN